MTPRTKAASAAGGIGAGGVALWLLGLLGIDMPPDAATGLGALLGWIIREITD